MKNIALILFALMALASCNSIEQKAKKVVNKTGEVAGETASEFVEGVSDGIDKTMKCEIELKPSIIESGISVGKHSIESNGGNDNQLSIYLIFKKAFNGEINAKAFDENGDEIGRSNLTFEAQKNFADYYDFTFNSKTNLDAKCKIVFELVE